MVLNLLFVFQTKLLVVDLLALPLNQFGFERRR